VIAYSTCIAHGIEMSTSMTHQKDAVRSGYCRSTASTPRGGVRRALTLDSREPSIPVSEFVNSEVRFSSLARSDPDRSAYLMKLWSATPPSAGATTASSRCAPDARQRRCRGRAEEDGEGADGSAAARPPRPPTGGQAMNPSALTSPPRISV